MVAVFVACEEEVQILLHLHQTLLGVVLECFPRLNHHPHRQMARRRIPPQQAAFFDLEAF